MNTKKALNFLIGIVLATLTSTVSANGHNAEIQPYVDALNEVDQSPCDYVMEKFTEKDLVLLCERAHPESTQYDLIFEIVSDQRFIDTVGHVYAEVGTSSLEEYTEAFLMDDSLSEEEVEARLIHIYQDFGHSAVWSKPNFYNFLKRVYYLNKTLPEEKKIHVHMADMPFSWEGMNAEDYAVYYKSLGNRDQAIAQQITDSFNGIKASGAPRQKALIIMNYRHAFPHLTITRGTRTKTFHNVGGYLMDAFPGSLANVYLNSIALKMGTTDNSAVSTAVQDGKWDAAFEVMGNTPAGFDFANTPFGKDSFDIFPLDVGLNYSDVFTGFIFYKALDEQVMEKGVPSIFAGDFKDEVARRLKITSPGITDEEIRKQISGYTSVSAFGYENKEVFAQADHRQKIDHWLQVTP